MKLCFFGDSGQREAESQGLVSDAIYKEDCDRIYLLGDIIYPKGIQNAEDPLVEDKFFSFYRKFQHSSHHPKLAIILGNHDYQGNPDSWETLAQREKSIFFPHPYYLEKIEGICLIALDTTFWIKSRYFLQGLKEMFWLMDKRDQLENECSKVVTITHHPYKTIRDKPHDSMFFQFVFKELILKISDVVISGHDHVVMKTPSYEGIHQFISGGGGRVYSGYLPGYMILTKDKNSNKLFSSLVHLSNDGKKIISGPEELK